MLLLLPIDTTAPSQLAVELAALIGQRLAEEVLLLHVSESPPPLDRLAELHALAAPIRDVGVPVRLRTVRGIAAERIPEVARERGATWILMGTSGEDFREGGGSTTRAVMRAACVPVIAVRPGVSPGDGDTPIALIATPPGHPAVEVARVLADAHGVQTMDLGVDPSPPATGEDASHARMSVAPFDPDCSLGTWCGRLLKEDRRPVVLVSGGDCACADPHPT